MRRADAERKHIERRDGSFDPFRSASSSFVNPLYATHYTHRSPVFDMTPSPSPRVYVHKSKRGYVYHYPASQTPASQTPVSVSFKP